jgi:hypothetical protein
MKPPRTDEEAAAPRPRSRRRSRRPDRDRLFGRQARDPRARAAVVTGRCLARNAARPVLNHEPLLEPGDCQRQQDGARRLRPAQRGRRPGRLLRAAGRRSGSFAQPALPCCRFTTRSASTATTSRGRADMADDIQDEDLVKADLRRQERLEQERAPLEACYRDAEQLCDPMAPAAFQAARRRAGAQLQFRQHGDGGPRPVRRGARRGHHAENRDAGSGSPCTTRISRDAGGAALARACERSRVGLHVRAGAGFGTRPARTAARSAATAPRRCGSTK